MSQIYFNSNAGGAMSVSKITGNSGSAVADGTGNINLVTANTNVQFVGAASTITQDFAPVSTNLFLGSSGTSVTSGLGNTSLGFGALPAITSGISNTAFGHVSSNLISTGNFNTAIGEGSLFNASSAISGSTAIGWHSMLLASGTNNTAVGYGTLLAGVSGSQNACVGAGAFTTLTTGSDNVAVGYQAGSGMTSANKNVVMGTFAGFNCDGAVSNVGIGYDTFNNSIGTSSGQNNVFVGSLAATAIGNANSNTGIGWSSLTNISTGAFNSCFGANSGSVYLTESSNICIMHTGVAADANTLRIGTQGTGSGQVNLAFIAGITGATVTGAGVLCSTAGQLGTVVSSERYKENIESINYDVSILDLTPSKFNYKVDINKQEQFGLIAEEVHEKFPYLCLYNDEGQPETVKYHEIPTLLLHELKKLTARVQYLESSRGEL